MICPVLRIMSLIGQLSFKEIPRETHQVPMVLLMPKSDEQSLKKTVLLLPFLFSLPLLDPINQTFNSWKPNPFQLCWFRAADGLVKASQSAFWLQLIFVALNMKFRHGRS